MTRTPRKTLLFCIVILCGAAAVIAAYRLASPQRKTEGSFFEIAGLAPEEVERISIYHEGTTVDLAEADQQRLLDSLSATSGQSLTFDHEYPYRISEYQIQLHAGDDVIEYPFAWFMGREGNVYTDRRVDVQIGDDWFSFEQTGDTFWNDTLSQMTFESAADAAGLTYFQPDKGQIIACPVGNTNEIDYSDPMLYIEQADLVVLATRVTTEYRPRYEGCYDITPTEIMKVTEVLKGDWDTETFLPLDNRYDPSLLLPNASSVYQLQFSAEQWAVYNPSGYTFIEDGKIYLLCLNYDAATDRYYSRYSFYHSLAAIYNDTAYACANYENHAFLELSLDEIRTMCTQ